MLRVLLVTLVCSLPLCCLAQRDINCGDAEYPPIGSETNVNEYRNYELGVFGGDCTSSLQCTLAISRELSPFLIERSWFIEDNKDRAGTTYPPDYLQLFRVTCPDRTLLRLSILRMDVACGSGFADFVEVSVPDSDIAPELFCGSLNGSIVQNSFLYNSGLGRILGQTALVQFRTNADNDVGTGFTLVATCIDPLQLFRTSCVDTIFTLNWDPEFVDIINQPFPPPRRVPAIHKRTVEHMKEELQLAKSDREKRFLVRFEEFQLGPNDTVTFTVDLVTRQRVVLIEFENGDVVPFDGILCLFTYNEVIGSLIFTTTPPRSFTGNGTIQIYKELAFLEHSINDFDGKFLPSPIEATFVETIYNYIYDNWIFPFPIIDQSQNRTVDPNIFPFSRADPTMPDLRFRQLEQLGVFLPEILGDPETAVCQRVFRPRVAPAAGQKIDEGIFEFCAFFHNSCNPTLRTACVDLLDLDF